MYNSIPEYLRKQSVESCFELSAFRNGWPTWKSEIQNYIGNTPQGSDILNIGDNLSSIFATTGSSGRSQSEVSGGGYGWEGLICWYLNICLVGSNAVALRKISDLPDPLRDSISVNYGNFKSNTESDITVVVFPNRLEFTNDKDNLTIHDQRGKVIPNLSRGNYNCKKILNRLAELHFDDFEIGIIQCKTNWNDNSQIPMLWSMIYEATAFASTSISVGKNGFTIHDLSRFSYSFCTVPTNSLDNYKQNSTAVNRVRNLTGGNYWGYPSKSGIASSLKEIFNNNFRNAYHGTNQRSQLNNAIQSLSNDLRYFDIL
ncbi:MAG: hypothetical protein ACQETL_07690 [Bacteroidota bacterium]